MIELLCGLIGFVFAAGLFALGFLAGSRYERGRKAPPPEPDEPTRERITKERERLEREQEAFWQLTGYSADIAYGMTKFPGEDSA